MTVDAATVRVLYDAAAPTLLHLPASELDTVAACGARPATVVVEDRPVTWAGVWCTERLCAVAGVPR